MKLNDKIWVCRKKAGLSQEALAERIGVSRQAISKWETGEAAPEISKLPLLARVFGVTADWLLDDSTGFEEESAGQEEPAQPVEATIDRPPVATAYPSWVENLPGFLVRLVKRFGWLVGVYVALGGAGTALLGAIGMAVADSMSKTAADSFSSLGGMFGGGSVTVYDTSGAFMDAGALGLDGGFSSAVSTVTQPFEIVCTVLTCAGLIVFAGGALLAWYLKKKGQEAL